MWVNFTFSRRKIRIFPRVKNGIFYPKYNLLITTEINIFKMKLSNLYIVLFFMLICSFGNSQSMKDFKKDIKVFKKVVSLDERQVNEVSEIYQKIIDDVAKLEQLNLSDEDFRKKRRAIYKGAQFSLDEVVNEEQKAAYIRYKREIRVQRAENLSKLKKQKASNQDLMDAEVGVKNIK